MDAVMQALQRLLVPLRLRIANLVARAVVQLVVDTPKLQELQLGVLEGETRERCERFQPYGCTSVPLPGAEAIVLFVGGLRDHPLVVCVDDRRYRKTGLQPGEVALYDHHGTCVLLKASQVVEVNRPIDLVDGAVYRVAGDQVVGPRGAAVPDSTPTVASVSTTLNLLLARARAHGLIES